MICPLCHNRDTVRTAVRDRYRCAGCCWFRWPVQPPVPHSPGAPSPIDPITERNRFIGIVRSIPGTGRLHDVGCGDGGLMAAAQFIGWEVTGNDLRVELLDTMPRHYRLAPILADYIRIPFPHGSLQAVTFHHGIEHLDDPIHALTKAWWDLEVGGHVLLVHPAISSEGAFVEEADHSVSWGAHCFEWMPHEFQKVITKSGEWETVMHAVSGGSQHWLLRKQA